MTNSFSVTDHGQNVASGGSAPCRAASKPPRDRAWFYVYPGEDVMGALARIRADGWDGPVGLSLALVA